MKRKTLLRLSTRQGRSSISFRLAPSISLLLVGILVSTTVFAQQSLLTISSGNRDPIRVSSLDTLNINYISASEFAQGMGFPAAINLEVRKFEFRLPTHRVKITAGNPFLVITNVSSNTSSVFQLPRPSLHLGGSYYVPTEQFFRLLTFLWPGNITYERTARTVSLATSPSLSDYDITGLDIESRANGYMMTIKAARPLGVFDKWLKNDGWLFVTIANAKADTATLVKQVRPSGAIQRFLVFQSPTSVQLTFKLTPDVVNADIVNEPGSNNLVVTLYTRTKAMAAELEKTRQESIRESLESQRDRWKLDVIVLDAGHGGKDPGTIGIGGTKEKDVTLAVTLKLGKLIEKHLPDVNVVYTRTTDTFIELYKRTQIANDAGGKLFVSIHCNSTPKKPTPTSGFEIYLLRPGKTESAIAVAERENSVIKEEEGYQDRYQELTEENFILVTLQQMSFMRYSERFAELASETMASKLRIKNSGVKQAGFHVLVGASMPNALVELGYLSNRNEEKVLRSSTGQTRIAEAMFEGIKEYKKKYELGLQEFEMTGKSN